MIPLFHNFSEKPFGQALSQTTFFGKILTVDLNSTLNSFAHKCWQEAKEIFIDAAKEQGWDKVESYFASIVVGTVSLGSYLVSIIVAVAHSILCLMGLSLALLEHGLYALCSEKHRKNFASAYACQPPLLNPSDNFVVFRSQTLADE